MMTHWTLSLPQDVQALMTGRKAVAATTKTRVHAYLSEIGSPDRALLVCAVIAAQLARQNVKAIPALCVIESLAAKLMQSARILDEGDDKTLPGEALADHFISVRDSLRTLSEAMQMTADVFGADAPRASWLAQAISTQCTAHALVAETVAEAHHAANVPTPRRKSRKNRSMSASI